MKLAAFFHVGILNCWKEVNSEILGEVKISGMLDALDILQVGIVGDVPENRFEFPFEHEKLQVGYKSDNLKDFEYPTLVLLQNYCKENPDAKVCSFHNAGVSRPKDSKYPEYRRLEVYHTISKWRECIEHLDMFDVCGINIQTHPVDHFSGTFWWANASYINKLIPVEDSKKIFCGGIGSGPGGNMHSAEFWISMLKDKNYRYKWKSLYNTKSHWIDMADTVKNNIGPYLESLPKEEKYWEVQNEI